MPIYTQHNIHWFTQKAFSALRIWLKIRQPPYSESKALERTRRQTKYEATLDQAETQIMLFPHSCAANTSLQNNRRQNFTKT